MLDVGASALFSFAMENVLFTEVYRAVNLVPKELNQILSGL